MTKQVYHEVMSAFRQLTRQEQRDYITILRMIKEKPEERDKALALLAWCWRKERTVSGD